VEVAFGMFDVTRGRHAWVVIVLGLSSLGLGAVGWAANADQSSEKKPYTVVDGKVDMATYNGYRRYDNSCLRCHGPDGAGSSYAPSLVESLKHISYEQFSETVINGKKNVSTSQQLVMPAFGFVEDVANNLDDIYAYLKARSDGALGRGRPERMAK
jgi:methanol metabolism-related c-type cytochrome